MTTGFTTILQRLVDEVPGSTGAIFADSDGEVVDIHPKSDDLLILGAQVGVIFALSQACMGLFHFGHVETMVLEHDKVDVVIRGVGHGTYVAIASPSPAPLAQALKAIDKAAADLAIEMG